jgi:hypothetical protein
MHKAFVFVGMNDDAINATFMRTKQQKHQCFYLTNNIRRRSPGKNERQINIWWFFNLTLLLWIALEALLMHSWMRHFFMLLLMFWCENILQIEKDEWAGKEMVHTQNKMKWKKNSTLFSFCIIVWMKMWTKINFLGWLWSSLFIFLNSNSNKKIAFVWNEKWESA